MIFLNENFIEAQHQNEVKLKGQFMRLVIAQCWRRRVKRWGGDRSLINDNLVRRNITFVGSTMYDMQRERAQTILKPFLQQNIDLEKIRVTVRDFYKSIEYMQKRMRAQLLTKSQKIEVLFNYWDKLFGQLQSRASKLKD
mmetsp:Transcript_13544/g.21126  ORF Transcript_13544/g.21126 Transcript_13544/m.21126 type:complete len:140 (+) Transcript_13544:1358-1777(+)